MKVILSCTSTASGFTVNPRPNSTVTSLGEKSTEGRLVDLMPYSHCLFFFYMVNIFRAHIYKPFRLSPGNRAEDVVGVGEYTLICR